MENDDLTNETGSGLPEAADHKGTDRDDSRAIEPDELASPDGGDGAKSDFPIPTLAVTVETGAAEQQTPALMYPVVGFGASAGGLQAFREVLENLSPTTGMAFVLATHLAPDQKSFLSEIVERYT